MASSRLGRGPFSGSTAPDIKCAVSDIPVLQKPLSELTQITEVTNMSHYTHAAFYDETLARSLQERRAFFSWGALSYRRGQLHPAGDNIHVSSHGSQICWIGSAVEIGVHESGCELPALRTVRRYPPNGTFKHEDTAQYVLGCGRNEFASLKHGFPSQPVGPRCLILAHRQ